LLHPFTISSIVFPFSRLGTGSAAGAAAAAGVEEAAGAGRAANPPVFPGWTAVPGAGVGAGVVGLGGAPKSEVVAGAGAEVEAAGRLRRGRDAKGRGGVKGQKR